MRVLVLGGAGFVGGYLCRELQKAGDTVTAIHFVPLASGDAFLGVRYERLDLDRDLRAFAEMTRDADAVVFSLPPSPLRTKRILASLANEKPPQKLVYLSTVLVYPDSDEKSNESVLPDPLTSYEREKVEEENLMTEFSDMTSASLCMVRLGNVYGGVKNRGIVNFLMRALVGNTTFVVNGDGSVVRDYIFVEDAARLVGALIHRDQKEPKDVFNVCTGEGISILELISAAERAAGTAVRCTLGPGVEEKHSVIGENGKLIGALGRGPEHSLATGLEKTQKLLIDSAMRVT